MSNWPYDDGKHVSERNRDAVTCIMFHRLLALCFTAVRSAKDRRLPVQWVCLTSINVALLRVRNDPIFSFQRGGRTNERSSYN